MIHFSTFKNVRDARNGVLHKITVEECLKKFLHTHLVLGDKDGPNFTLAHYINIHLDNSGHERVHRCSENIIGTYGLGLDIDNEEGYAICKPKDLEMLFSDYTYALYTTYSHLEDGKHPRFRIILFFDRMLEKEKYAEVWDYFRAMIPADVNVDPMGRVISHAWYKPAYPNRLVHLKYLRTQIKKLINVDEVLKQTDLAVSGFEFSSTDQRFATQGTTEARSSPIYNTNSDNVKQKSAKFISKLSDNNSLTNLTHSLNNINEVQERVIRVLSEPEMHVSNFTGASYNEWITIGCALKGAGLPFSVFDDWSSKDLDKYREGGGSQGLLKRWNGFNGSAKEGSIFEMAKQRGVAHYLGIVSAKRETLTLSRPLPATIKTPEIEPDQEEVLSYDESLEYKPRPKDNKLRAFPLELCDRAPENIARYMEYVLETNTHPHPVFALANSISTLGSLYHQRVQAKYKRCCPNMYILTLALAGQGKAHAFNCSRALYRQLGLVQTLGNIPASTAGLITGLRVREGNMYMLVDEFEKKFLRMLNSKAAGAHYIQVSGELMNIYTIPHEPYIGEMMYADSEKNNKAPIPNPHLSIYGACIDDDFYKHYAGEGAEDGFLARIMPFINKEYYPQVNQNYKEIEEIPEGLLKFCRNIIKDPIVKIGADLDMSIKPRIIDFDSEKTKRFHGVCVEHWRSKTWNEGQDGNKKVASLYSRLCENALKIAIAAHEGNVITREVWEWALEVSIALTETSINNAIVVVAENTYQTKINKMENLLVKHGGWMSKDQITQKFRDERRVRDDILQWLIEAGKVVHRRTKLSKNAKKEAHEFMAI